MAIVSAKRVNAAPVAVIIPASQTVQLPNDRAILDGSKSVDDLENFSFTWELEKGPIGYQFESVNTATLVMKGRLLNNQHK